MAYIRIFNPPNVTADVYDRVNAETGVDRDPPAGLLFHSAGEVDGPPGPPPGAGYELHKVIRP